MQQMRAVAAGCHQADVDRRARTITVLQYKIEALYAGVAGEEITAQLQQQASRDMKQRLGMTDFGLQRLPSVKNGWWLKIRTYLGQPSRRAVELIEQRLTATLGETIARQSHHFTQCPQSATPQ